MKRSSQLSLRKTSNQGWLGPGLARLISRHLLIRHRTLPNLRWHTHTEPRQVCRRTCRHLPAEYIIMAAFLPTIRSRCSLAKHHHPFLFWSCFILILIIMFVPATVLGLFSHFSKRGNASSIALTVDLGYSKYQGANAGNGVSQWLGIRYAASPLENLRFRAPEDPRSNNTVQIANTVCWPAARRV